MTFGDSLTEGERTPAFWGLHDPGTPGSALSYPFKLWSILKTTYTAQTISVFNVGLGGELVTTSAARMRFADAIRDRSPQLIILMHGTNDLSSEEIPRQTTVDAVEELIRDAQARNVTLFLSEIPRMLPGVGNPPKGSAAGRVIPYNEDLRRIAEKRNVPFIFVYQHITDAMISPADGLHLTQAGNQRLAELYYDAIRARYHVPAASSASR